MSMYQVLEETFNGWNIIRITEGDFSGCEFTMGRVVFSDKENPDGSVNVEIDYDITNKYEVLPERVEEFASTLGSILIELMETGAAAA